MDWGIAYRIVIPLIALSFLTLSIMFLLLRPRGRMEWVTTLATIALSTFFLTLTYWLYRPGAIVAVIFPPLVIAALLTMLAMVAFTAISLEDWWGRRR
jgi:cbb3-type cytochrome oxidase subunit 3